MHKNKVIAVLNSLSAAELRQLDKFVRSPIHNQHEDVVKLFQYLRRHLSANGKGLEKEKVYQHLFGDVAFNMQQLHYVSSYLLKVMEEFLAWSEWSNNSVHKSLTLLRAFRSHNLDLLFDSQIEKMVANLESGVQDTRSLFLGYEVALERFNNDQLKPGKQNHHLQEMSDALDTFIVAEKLRCACILLSNQTVNTVTYDTGLLNDLIAFAESHSLLKNTLVAVYYYALKTLQNTADDYAYQQLKSLLEIHRNSLNISELHDIYILTLNYCIRQLNRGEQSFMKEVFHIYRMGLESDSFVQNGIMSPRTYSNIIMSGLKMREFEWVGKFIHEYKSKLPLKEREGFFNYNLARLHYEQRNYTIAMPLLLQMEYKDALLACLGKLLLAKMYFEQNEYESLSSLLSSFKVYVQRKKMTGAYNESYLNFMHFLGKLMQKTQVGAEKLKTDITETKVVAEKEWLLAQL